MPFRQMYMPPFFGPFFDRFLLGSQGGGGVKLKQKDLINCGLMSLFYSFLVGLSNF